LFGIILIVALIIVGLGTFLLSKARNFVQNADFWTDSISQLVSNLSAELEAFFARIGSLSGLQSLGRALHSRATG